MNENFLLTTSLAQRLFHNCAETLPIIDYHNHLDVGDLARDRAYENLTQLWVRNDPYKHRAMRICGVPEQVITGPSDDRTLYDAWMQVLPRLLGNPLYDWSVLEMQRIFGISLMPGHTDPDALWRQASERLREPGFTVRGLLKRFGVAYLAPCVPALGDPAPLANLPGAAPSLRGDGLLCPDSDVRQRLAELTGVTIDTLAGYAAALRRRLDVFAAAGCLVADHALDNGFGYRPEDGTNEQRFARLLAGQELPQAERDALASAVLRILAGEYARRGWLMQLHLGAQRATSTRLRRLAGPAGGFAGIGCGWDMGALARMLDDWEQAPAGLPRIVLFPLNPADNTVMAVLSGSFPGDGASAQVQLGPAWWWCDHRDGIRAVLEAVSDFGVLSTWIGMTTDSRSPLSFVRHEYFRRVLCEWIGERVRVGALPAAESALQPLVEALCYRNAQQIILQNGEV